MDNTMEELKEMHRQYREVMIAFLNKMEHWLRQRYTPEKMKEFREFQDFLDDINEACSIDSTAKILFIHDIEKTFFNTNTKP